MKLQVEVLFILFALEFQCLKGDVEILKKYKNQRIYSAQDLHIKVAYNFELLKLYIFILGNGKAD